MAKIHSYLNFNGNCSDAFEFYQSVFKKDYNSLIKFGDMPNDDPNFQLAEEDKNKILHVSILLNDNQMLMGSDCLESFGQTVIQGTNSYIMLDTDTAEEAKLLFDTLSVDANKIEMPLGEQFFAELYASFIDKFGTAWMIHFEGNKKI